MTERDQLLEIERAGWDALSTEGAAGPFYDRVLADQVLMLLPGGMLLDDRSDIVASMRGAAWDAFELTDERVLELSEGCAVVAYRADARRGDQHYRALFSSVYVRDGDTWRLALHQQTPE